MRIPVVATILTLVWCLSSAPVLWAKGGGHGGGHSGGGHSGGGHASGGHSGSGHASGGHTGGHAAKGSASGSSQGSSSRGGTTTSRAAAAPPAPPPGGRAREDRPILGTAVPRVSTPRDLFLASPATYAPHFVSPFVGLGLYAPAFGLRNRFFYSACWDLLDCAPPVMSGLASVPPPAPVESDVQVSGNLRLDVLPIDAQVFVDGYYVGEVADVLQTLAGLNLPAGPHHVEFRAAGYDTLAVDVQIAPNRTITYRAALKRLP